MWIGAALLPILGFGAMDAPFAHRPGLTDIVGTKTMVASPKDANRKAQNSDAQQGDTYQ